MKRLSNIVNLNGSNSHNSIENKNENSFYDLDSIVAKVTIALNFQHDFDMSTFP
jgi:hypothetical protein